jgi:hypothetical protein
LSVLNWNKTAIDFYVSCAAHDLTKAEGLHTFRNQCS